MGFGRHKATVSAFSQQLFNTGGLSEESDGQSILLPMDGTWASQFVRALWRRRDDVAHCKIGRNSSARVKSARVPTLPRSVYGVAAFSIFFFLSRSAINSWECRCLSYFMCHWLQQSLVKNFHCVHISSLFLPASALDSTFWLSLKLSDLSSSRMLSKLLAGWAIHQAFSSSKCFLLLYSMYELFGATFYSN